MTAETAKKYAWLEQLGTEELEGMLRAEAFSAESDDPELTDLILEVIAKRKEGQLPDPAQAMEDFDRLYRNLKKPLYPLDDAGERPPARPNIVRRVLIAASAAILMVMTMSIPVLGYESVFQMLGQWTAEQFGFRAVGTPSEVIGGAPLREVPEEYAELQTALNEKGIDYFLFPVLPEDFDLVEANLFTESDSRALRFDVLYLSDTNSFAFTIFDSPSSRIIHEKDDREVDIYIHHGIEHYIFSNVGSISVAWYTDGFEYSIATDISVSEVKEIVNSMYEE